MIVDCHAHIRTNDPAEIDALLGAADRAGVDKICICSLSREWVEFPSPAQLDEAADDVLDVCERHADRFVGGTYVSADHVSASLDVIERTIAEGPCRFIKLWVSQYADDERLNPIVERCIELDVPFLAHSWIKATGNMTRETTCYHVVNMARRYPKMKIWLAHCSGRWEEVARIIRDTPNVCVDVSGGEPEDGIVDCLLKHIGADRVFWGSDVPGRSFVVQMSKVLSANVTADEKAMILGGNVRRWIRV